MVPAPLRPQQPDFNWDNPEVREDFHDTLRFWSDRGVAGFRVDVAHGLAKDLRAPLRDLGEQRSYQPDALPADGSHPLWDRDAVHEIYRGWRHVFDAYDPPRFAVAEAWVRASRRTAYASAAGLGQAFNFDFLGARLDAAELHTLIDGALADARGGAGATSTWVLSNHDVVRHVSRYALPGDCTKRDIEAWLLTDGREPAPDLPTGVRKARRRGAADARPARVRVRLSGRGAGSARGRRPGPRGPARPDVGAQRRTRQGPRRLPGAAAVDP